MKRDPARRASDRTSRIPLVIRRVRPRSRGQAMVEFALIVPIVLLLLVIAIDFGRAFFTFIQLNNAAREGAAYAAGNPTDSGPGGGIWTAATLEKNSQDQGGEGAMTVAVSCAQGQTGFPVPSPSPMDCANAAGGTGPGNTVTVTLSEPFTFITPLVGNLVGSPFILRASATAAVLGLAASGGTGPGGCTAGPSMVAFSVSKSGNTVTVDATASQPTTGVNAITGYNWDWGDGTDPYLQEGVHFTHTYASGPPWTITLTVENPCGTLQDSETILAPTPTPTVNPSASPSPSPTPTIAPTATPTTAPTATPGTCTAVPDFTWTNNKKVYSFLGSVTGQPAPTQWHWDFGDGTTQVTTGSTVSHTYGSSSSYTVKLYVTGGSCTSPTVSKGT